jgi:hypothetical protein
MSQEFEDFRARRVTEAQMYIDEHLKEWPCDNPVVDWPDGKSVLIFSRCTAQANHNQYSCEIATNCPELDKIGQFQAVTDALPNYKLPRMAHQSLASMEAAESRWTMKNKDTVEASLQNLIQCVQNHDPEISVYEGIPVDAFEQLSARNNTKLHYQSQRPATSTTMIPDTDLPRNDETQAAQSEADANSQL